MDSTSSLSYWLTAESLPRLLVERTEIGDLARGDQHATGVHANVAHHALHLHGQAQQFGHLFFGGLALLQLRRFLAGVDDAGVGLFGHAGQGHRFAGRRRDQLGDGVDLAEAHAQHPPDVAQRRLGRHGAEGGDLAHRLAPVLVLDVVDDAVAVGLAEVDVEVGHRHPLRVQEALEQQVVLQRVQVGDQQAHRPPASRHQNRGPAPPGSRFPWPT